MNDNAGTVENLLRQFPIALQTDKQMQIMAAVIARALAVRWEEAEIGILYPAIDLLPETVLDILAYDLKVDWYDYGYSIEEKRRTLRNAWKVHRIKGTKAAVETAISAIYPNTTVQEWFEYGGEPYHFQLKINISGDDIDSERRRRVLDRLYYYKNLRSHNDGIRYFMEPQAAEAVAAAGHAGLHFHIGIDTELELSGTSPRSQAEVYAGAISSGRYLFAGTANVPFPELAAPQAESEVQATAGAPRARLRMWPEMELSGISPKARAEIYAGAISSGRYLFAGTANVPFPGLSPPQTKSAAKMAAGVPRARMRMNTETELSGNSPQPQAGAYVGISPCGYYMSAAVAVKTKDMGGIEQ